MRGRYHVRPLRLAFKDSSSCSRASSGAAVGAHGLLCRLAALPGERRTATSRIRHNSPAHPLIRHTASLTISRPRSQLISPDENACMPRAAAQGTSRPRPHHRRRARGRVGCHLDRALPLRAYRSGPPAFPATGLRSLPPAAYTADRAVVTSVTLSLWWGSDDVPAVADLACPLRWSQLSRTPGDLMPPV